MGTWSGNEFPRCPFLDDLNLDNFRAAIRYDTVSIVGVSLNVKDRVTATVWRSSGLPMTIHSCLSLPMPVGGVCLFGDNEIVYLNQSVPPCGISLNSCAEGYTRFPLNNERQLHMTLDGCAHEALSPCEVFVCARDGDLYVLSLTIDLSNAVKSMKLKKVTGKNLTLCREAEVLLPKDLVLLCDIQKPQSHAR